MPARGSGPARPDPAGCSLVPAGAPIILQVDGTPGAVRRGQGGVGVVVRDATGRVLTWHAQRVPAATCHEAEYQAVIIGLALVLRLCRGARVRCLTDNRVVAEQISGRASVRVPGLVALHARAIAVVQAIGTVEVVAVPRELNRLADALAWEALGGRSWIARAGQV